jgi:hypothetical protein
VKPIHPRDVRGAMSGALGREAHQTIEEELVLVAGALVARLAQSWQQLGASPSRFRLPILLLKLLLLSLLMARPHRRPGSCFEELLPY